MKNAVHLKQQVDALEKQYIVLLQKRAALPSRRPTNGSKARQEREISDEAYFLLQELNGLSYANTAYAAALDDRKEGCMRMINDPYNHNSR
ncbi:hypothetical protein KYK14_09930 [Hymenobacter profundi]|uniref:Uncharacterized protein n=1 Tax=Hymenobacter profundi TaxID=1982110 RepID=A0ABS6WZ38_9BACT|nr:hypothetical protein [Hymenobacter profundi]